MRFTRTKAVIAVTGLALSLAACGDAGDDTEGADVEVQEDASSEFEDGTRMKELADAGADQDRREVRPARPRLQGRRL